MFRSQDSRDSAETVVGQGFTSIPCGVWTADSFFLFLKIVTLLQEALTVVCKLQGRY